MRFLISFTIFSLVTLLTSCQQSIIHPSMPLSMPMHPEFDAVKTDIFVINAGNISQRVGEGETFGDPMGEVLLDQSPQKIVTNRLQKFSKNFPQKASLIESCEIRKFSSFYRNEIAIWAVHSEVELHFKLRDKSSFSLSSKKDCKSMTLTLGDNLKDQLDEALTDVIAQLAEEI